MTLYNIIRKERLCYINPIPQETSILSKTLNKYLSYIKQGAQFFPNPLWGVVHLYSVKKGCFQVGLIAKVRNIFEQYIKYNSADSYKINLNYDYLTKEWIPDEGLRDYQVNIVKELIRNRGGFVQMSTGSGKTRVAISFIKYVNETALVIVTTIDLKSQWKKQLEKYSVNADVMTYQSIKDKTILQKYKVIVIDEAHHQKCDSLYKISMNCGDSILVGLSATAKSETKDDLKIEACLGKIIVNLSTRELIKKGYLCDAKVYYININNETEKYISYQDAYKKYIVENRERNIEIAKLCEKHYIDGKILIICSQIEHCNNIADLLMQRGMQNYIVFNGQLPKKQRKILFDEINNNKYKIVIASTVFDEGVDLIAMQVLALATGGKSAIKVVQRIGRLLRPHKDKDFAIIYDFYDKGNKHLLKHSKQRRQILSETFDVKDYV